MKKKRSLFHNIFISELAGILIFVVLYAYINGASPWIWGSGLLYICITFWNEDGFIILYFILSIVIIIALLMGCPWIWGPDSYSF